MEDLSKKYILFYDGICKFCHGTVNFVIKRDKKDLFRYICLQSNLADEMLIKHGINGKEMNSFYIMENAGTPHEKVYQKSEAVIKLFGTLNFPWNMMKIGYLCPRFIRDFFYMIHSKTRYQLHGKYDACEIPDKSMMYKFLDANE